MCLSYTFSLFQGYLALQNTIEPFYLGLCAVLTDKMICIKLVFKLVPTKVLI